MNPEHRLIEAHPPQWDGVDRRRSDRVLEMVQRQLEALSEEAGTLSKELRAHITNSAERHSDLSAKITGTDAVCSGIMQGFPNDDPRGHREYHEELIEHARARKEFWQKLALELAKAGLIGFSIWALAALWESFLKGPK